MGGRCVSRQVFQMSRLVPGVKKVIATLIVDLKIRDVSGEHGAWELGEGKGEYVGRGEGEYVGRRGERGEGVHSPSHTGDRGKRVSVG